MIALLIAAAIEAGVCVHSMNQMVRSINPVAEVYAESVPDAQV